jgi:membrane protease YdiL (CAAX protease family)
MIVPPVQHLLPPPGPQLAPPREPHPTLPWPVAVGAVVVLTVSLLISKYVLEWIVDYGWPVAAYVAILGVLGYGPSIVWAIYASRRWGSGDVLDDVGVRPRWSDLGWGPLIWLAALGCQVVVGAIVLALDIPLSNNTDGITELQADRTYVVAIVIAAVIAAPIVEEVVFRGLVLRGSLDRMPAVLAIVVQGVVFGIAHIDPVRGAGNVGLAMILSAVGIALGGAAYLLRRTSPTIVAHAIFNGVVMAIVLSGVADDLREDNDDLFGGVSTIVERSVVDQADIAEPHGRRNPR